MSGAGGKNLFNILSPPTVSDDINHSPQQPTCPRVTDICQLMILTLLHAAEVIQTLSRTRDAALGKPGLQSNRRIIYYVGV